MTTPYEGEYGEWHGSEILDPANADRPIVKNHLPELNEIWKLEGVARDEYYKEIAIRNIKANPVKYLRNCIANAGRMMFDAPLYFASPTDLFIFRILPTCVLIPFMFFAIAFVLLRWKTIPFGLQLAFLITLLYFSLAILVSAYNRHFYILVPSFLVFIAYVFENFVELKWRDRVQVDKV
jgi:hypothetical protein